MVELQIVILAVAGSSPVGHPNVISDFDGVAVEAGENNIRLPICYSTETWREDGIPSPCARCQSSIARM